MENAATTEGLLGALTKNRLQDLGRIFNVAVPAHITKDAQVRLLADSGFLRFAEVVRECRRDELKLACRSFGLDDSGRLRDTLQARLLSAHGDAETATLPLFHQGGADHRDSYTPYKGAIVRVRHRQWLVEEVTPPPEPGETTRVSLVCLDDDNQGRSTEVLWELELGAKVLRPEREGLGAVTALDAPRHFAAYLHALKWGSVTATDPNLFQAPFRAGIKLMNHQLTPLKKALSLPRVNLFIADDVGLGKTIEAGLVLQELRLRQRVDFTLIVCPASVTLQWKEEMENRFGLHFEIYNRSFLGARRREWGFGINPWTTHRRFIISYQTLRRPEYFEPLLQRLGPKAHKSLLILDEAHTAAPASATKYAQDSHITKMVRKLAPAFENRLFLSATPHNGHSNSFSALLELLDPQRFTRGVPIRSEKPLQPVLVRRLKADLIQHGSSEYPRRRVVEWLLYEEASTWWASASEGAPQALACKTPVELVLAEKLRAYRDLMTTQDKKKALVFANLQKRLLSSVYAFESTLGHHARSVGSRSGSNTGAHAEAKSHEAGGIAIEDDTDLGLEDDAQESLDAEAMETASAAVPRPEGEAHRLLAEMQDLARRHKHPPDAKVYALVDWLKQNLCPAVAIAGDAPPGADRAWNTRRVIVFTEYGHTLTYLQRILREAVAGTEQGEFRIETFHGGLDEDRRHEIQRAFQGDPAVHPVRILLATDAAREGINLQNHCADLFHFDIPWNPARMEQRNGRIDRTLQPSPEVRCHYFRYRDRIEDQVLDTLLRKTQVIQRELGSLSAVVFEQMERVLEGGIGADTGAALDRAEQLGGKRGVVENELETTSRDYRRLAQEINLAGKILDDSRKVMDFRPALLKDAVDVGLAMAGTAGLSSVPSPGPDLYEVPDLPPGWRDTVDSLREPRGRNQSLWEWRKEDNLRKLTFEPPSRMDEAQVHLHLEHPFVKRILSRFRAQGFSAHDLSRVTVLRNPRQSTARAIAFGRLSLFGAGASRLHDELVAVAAPWLDPEDPDHLKPSSEKADREALDALEDLLASSAASEPVGAGVKAKLQKAASGDFAALWPMVKAEAQEKETTARQKLLLRGRTEAEALRVLLRDQQAAIQREMEARIQTTLVFTEAEREQKRQYEEDKAHMERRLHEIAQEITTEPEQIEAVYEVKVSRMEPVGLVYLWPETRT